MTLFLMINPRIVEYQQALVAPLQSWVDTTLCKRIDRELDYLRKGKLTINRCKVWQLDFIENWTLTKISTRIIHETAKTLAATPPFCLSPKRTGYSEFNLSQRWPKSYVGVFFWVLSWSSSKFSSQWQTHLYLSRRVSYVLLLDCY